MKKISYLFLMIGLVLGLFSSAWGSSLFTVELLRSPSLDGLVGPIASLKNLPGLWINRSDSQSSLRVGLFPIEKDAIPLLQTMKKSFPKAQIVTTPQPQMDQWVPSFERISLENLGYLRPVLSQGVHSYTSFHFPWSKAFSPMGSSLHFSLKTSPSLAPTSTLTILAEGIPLYSLKLSGTPRLEVDVPLDALENIPIGKTLNIEIRGYLAISGNQCVDETTGNLWILIDNKSYLTIKRLHPPATVQDFFRKSPLRLNIIPQISGENYVEAVSNLAILAGYVSRSRLVPLMFQPYVPTAYNIFIGSYYDDIRVFGHDLYLTPKGARLLVSRWLHALIFRRIQSARFIPRPAPRPRDITFAQLGYSGSLMRGIGEMIARVPLPATRLGGWPSKLLCTLLYAHSPISDKERAFLKVRFNGVLLESREIKGQGGIHAFTFSIPARYFNAHNHMDVAFAYYRNSGNCQGNFPEMEVSVMRDSFFSVKSYQKKPRLTIGSYPAICTGHGALVLKDLSEENWRPLLPLLENLGRNQSVTHPIELVSWNEFNQGRYDFGIMNLGLRLPAGLEPVVRLGESLVIVNPVTKKTLLRVETTDPAAAIQTFYTPKGIPIVLYSQKRGIRVIPETMMKAISPPTPANVTLFTLQTWVGMEIGKKLHVIYPELKGFSYYWALYRLIVFIALGAIILIFLFFVFHKLSTREDAS